MSTSFEIGFIHPSTGDFLPLRDPSVTKRHFSDATFSLIVDGIERVGEAWSLGPLERLIRQLAYVRDRLTQGHWALLRSGVEDRLPVPYFLFEPQGETMKISEFFIAEIAFGTLFPDEDAGNGQRLYAHVAGHREALLSVRDPDTFREVSYPRAALLADIAAQLEAAAQLVQRLG